jgi:hypothetical protein
MVLRMPNEVSCALSAGRKKGHFNILGESGRVAEDALKLSNFSQNNLPKITPRNVCPPIATSSSI